MIIPVLLKILSGFIGITLCTAVFFLISASIKSGPKQSSLLKRAEKKALVSGTGGRSFPGGFRAVIQCAVTAPIIASRYHHEGMTDCHALESSFNGNLVCEYGCLGLGSCVYSCPRQAIVLEKGTIRITPECNGCGLCIDMCPKALIRLVPALTTDYVHCAAHNRGDQSAICPIAKNSYVVSMKNAADSGFKIWKEWAILVNKLR